MFTFIRILTLFYLCFASVPPLFCLCSASVLPLSYLCFASVLPLFCFADICSVSGFYLPKGVRLMIDRPNVTSSVYSSSSPTEMPLANTVSSTS